MGGGGVGEGGITRKFGFINGVDDVTWPPSRISKAVVSNVGPSSERIVELWALYSL